MKNYVLAFTFLLLFSGTYAQTNPLEAKAAYLLAEESYGKGDMRATLQYLDDAINKLGGSNAKILYLKIVSLKELSAKDTAFASKLDFVISEFEKLPDVSSFNEEKTLEVMKIKLERNKEKNRKVVMQKGFEDLQKEFNCYIGMGIDSVIDLHRDVFKAYFKENSEYFIMRYHKTGRKADSAKQRVDVNGSLWSEDKNGGGIKKIIGWKDGKLSYFSYFYYNHPFGKEASDFSLSRKEQVPILEKFKGLFGYLPEPVQTSSSVGTTTAYNWILATGRSVHLSIAQLFSAGIGSSSNCVVTVY